ncbi:DNA cytosine methyltransferase [Burkholderia thailandensis]|uniref:DNA cytosine methyltransferase n=1 Tax=Burkholderia thailandensis TaxID=57975 RepID=UPI001F011672|nr:DNA cytosine methyltransferase [Burkholderia thailandensis]
MHPDDLRGYAQCHFFAGVGVWSYALRRAGWPDDRPVWTGSCPCQPFSAAGKGLGFDDERHLWPAWYWLIGECRPAVIFGEQVASSAVEPWIDLVHADMEALDHAFGCVPFPSAGVGSPHIRDRAFWMAHANSVRSRRNAGAVRRAQAQVDREGFEDGCQLDRSRASRATRRLADADCRQRDGLAVVRGVECNRADTGRPQGSGEPESRRELNHLVIVDADTCVAAGPTNGFWRDADWLLCRDGKWRPVEPGTFPLAHRAPARVGRLRAYGNAINAEAAVAWIEACRGVIG